MKTAEICRPLLALEELIQTYPMAWKQVDTFRSMKSEMPDWPDWCYLPIGAAYAITGPGFDLAPLCALSEPAPV